MIEWFNIQHESKIYKLLTNKNTRPYSTKFNKLIFKKSFEVASLLYISCKLILLRLITIKYIELKPLS